MIDYKVYASRDAWLEARAGTVGGSDAGCILGLNKWRTNVELWEIMTGRRQPEDISENPAVKYGTEAEKHIRALFALDYPDMEVKYEENNMLRNDRYPFAHFSADGLLKDSSGRIGILEIKTTTISSALQKAQWKDKIPDSYYAQLLLGMLVTETKFCYLRALMRYDMEDGFFSQIRDYKIERDEVEDDLKAMASALAEFERCVREDRRPALILPEI